MSTDQTYPPLQPVQKNSGLAIASLVCGIVAYTFLPFLAAIAAVITGHMAMAEINRSNGVITGKGMAITGLVMGYIQIVCLFIFILLLIFLLPQISTIFTNITGNMHY
jgi:hypothetical protein